MNGHAKYHHNAMSKMDEYDEAIEQNDFALAHAALEKALQLESKAASLVPLELEPTRSVLYRSAASLALEAGKPAEARELAAEGLRGQPPMELREELLALLLPESVVAVVPSVPRANAIVQTLIIRRGSSRKGRIPFQLATKIQEYWSRLYEDVSYALLELQPKLFPIEASPGSYILRIQVEFPDQELRTALKVAHCVRALGSRKASRPESVGNLELSGAFCLSCPHWPNTTHSWKCNSVKSATNR